MVEIYNFMNKGEAALTKSELKKLADMSVAAEKYEDEILGLKLEPKPHTSAAIDIRFKS